jgi:5-(carboxyamino)imidazole ribonucleotide synthase
LSSDRSSSPILPGATLAILGGGQLGRMTAMAARPLGYHVTTLDPDPSCASRFVVERCLTAGFDDVAAATELAKGAQVVTIEIEKISIEAMRAAQAFAPVRPGPEVLEIIQDRGRQKAWLADHGFPVGPYREVSDAKALAEAAQALGGKLHVKVCWGGYDGRGQAVLERPDDAARVFGELGGQRSVAEKGLALAQELSVLVARSPSGEIAVYAPSLNHHVKGVLEWSVLPGPIAPALAKEAQEIARGIAEQLQMEGLLVTEFFHTEAGELFVNELAPRPHNSFHTTEVACATSQFEQAVRAICDLPLGSTEIIRPAAIVNLLGDLWVNGEPDFPGALALPGVRLHLYGKRQARPGRKMGHLSAIGATPQEALERVQAAYARLATVAGR